MKASELRNLTKDELQQKSDSLKQELFKLYFQAKTGRIEKPSRIRQIKRDIARINTISRMQQLQVAIHRDAGTSALNAKVNKESK